MPFRLRHPNGDLNGGALVLIIGVLVLLGILMAPANAQQTTFETFYETKDLTGVLEGVQYPDIAAANAAAAIVSQQLTGQQGCRRLFAVTVEITAVTSIAVAQREIGFVDSLTFAGPALPNALVSVYVGVKSGNAQVFALLTDVEAWAKVELALGCAGVGVFRVDMVLDALMLPVVTVATADWTRQYDAGIPMASILQIRDCGLECELYASATDPVCVGAACLCWGRQEPDSIYRQFTDAEYLARNEEVIFPTPLLDRCSPEARFESVGGFGMFGGWRVL